MKRDRYPQTHLCYLLAMKSVSHNTSLSLAEDTYQSAIANSVLNLSNPKSIKDELVYLKEFLSKLKFQYLEQETRDKFLRLLLIGEEEHVTQDQVDALTENNLALKLQLKQLKSELHQLVDESTNTAEEVIFLNKEFAAQEAELNADIEAVKKLQSDLDAVLDAPENENYKILFNLNKMIDSDDLSLDEAIQIAQNAYDKDVTALALLEDDETKAGAAFEARKELLSELLERLLNLKVLVEKSRQTDDHDKEPDQVHVQWIRGLNKLLRKFINTEVELSVHNGYHTLSLNGQTIVLDSALNIVAYENSCLTRRSVEFINAASGDKKFWKLLHLLSAIVLK